MPGCIAHSAAIGERVDDPRDIASHLYLDDNYSCTQYDAQKKTALQGPAAARMNEDGHAAIMLNQAEQPGKL
jgi:hypothetical protein